MRAAHMGGRRVLCLPLFVFLLSSVKTSISFELRRKATVSGLCFLFADNGHFFINSLDKQKSHHTITPNVSYQNKHFHSNSWARNHLQDLAHGTASTKTTYSSTSFPRGLVNISLSQHIPTAMKRTDNLYFRQHVKNVPSESSNISFKRRIDVCSEYDLQF